MWDKGTIRPGSQDSRGDGELRMIPQWALALAVAVFIGVQYFFLHVMPAPHRAGMLPNRLLTAFTWASAFASYILLIGYISRDARRRNMSAKLWILIAIVIPGFIGAVVYFLLRQPVLSRCPNCTTEIADFHFCPQCQFQLAPVCGQCFRGVKITDVYCGHCGHDLAKDQTPARLRAYSN
jgi:hypothetical protein